jgi:hypothetical protein
MNSTDDTSKTKALIVPLSKILNEIIEENNSMSKIGILNII